MSTAKINTINAIIWAFMILGTSIIFWKNGVEVSNNVHSSLTALFVAGWMSSFQLIREVAGNACCN